MRRSHRARGLSSAVALLVAVLDLTGCVGQPVRAGARMPSATPPVGTYPLADSIAIVIESGPSLRIADDSAHALVRQDEGWTAPALGVSVEVQERDGARGLLVRRYGESVFVTLDESPDDESRSAPHALAYLTPRLMIGLNVPGVGIALIRDGRIVWRGYFGVKRAGAVARVDSLTIFEAASMSKPAYAYPFMKLVDNGLVALDTPLVRYLGRDYIADDTLHRAITSRMVLSHTTGFPNWRDDDEGLRVEFSPGTQVGYSGEGFQYLQTAVESITGKPMAEFARENLFDPLGLSSASYVWLPEYDSIAAYGHAADGTPREREPYLEANAAYTLYTTPVDYARILIEIMRADRSAAHSLSDATRALMLASQHAVPDREPIARRGQQGGEVHFALGWRFDRTADGDIYWHSGANSTGFQCYAEFDPISGDGIVVMTNSSSGSPLWRALMAKVDLGAP